MKKSNQTIFRCAVTTLALALMTDCAMDAPLSQDYYAGTAKIAGGNPPSVPVVTFNKSQLRFDFTASIDPETSAEVSTYYVYSYTGIPQTYYQVRNIIATLSSPSVRGFNISAPADGTYTVITTGFDGYRESAVTDQNRIIFSWP